MSRILSTAKLILFAAIFGAMIFVGCNNSSSDDETNGGGNTTVPDDSGTGGVQQIRMMAEEIRQGALEQNSFLTLA